jgi:DNA-binding CsgD family transcriptional regulator
MSTPITSAGRKKGPKFKLTPQQAEEMRIAHAHSDITVEDIALRFGVTKQTVYNTLKRLREASRDL